MTKDDAIKILADTVWPESNSVYPERWVNAFITLGVLKVEQPKGPYEKFDEKLVEAGFNEADKISIGAALARAGLKVVEK